MSSVPQAAGPVTRRASVPARAAGTNARGQSTRRRLLEAATVVFHEKGYFETRVEDIAQVAGTSRATMYHYFADKEELALELLADAAAPLAQSLCRLEDLGPGPGGLDVLRSWLVEVGHVYDHHGGALRLWARIDGTNSHVGRVGDRFIRGMTARLAQRLRAAGVEDLDHEIAAVAVLTTVERVQLSRIRSTEMSVASAAVPLADLLHRMLFP
jgi:AcrR family transcriptional regulator